MATTSLGDMVSSFAFRARNLGLKQDIQRLSTEMTTGKVSDVARRFSGDLGMISGIDSTLARLGAYATQTTEAGLYAATMQTSLGTLDTLATNLRKSLMTVGVAGTTAQITALGAEAHQSFEAAVSSLNISVGAHSLFSGVDTATPALASAESILTALDAVVLATGSTQGVVSAVSDWFDDPAGFAAQAYLGGTARAGSPIAAGESANLDITATDPAIIASLKGLALAALLDRGLFAGQPEQQRALATAAGETLDKSLTPRADLSARLGLTEAQIDAAKTRNEAEKTALQISRNDLLSVDPYEAATKLQQAQTQLETIYAVTARMSRLRLMDYL
jgi:flagellar hook-associated protein 3 FlgL